MLMQIFRNLDDKKISQLLKDGSVGVIPTDTVYGLVCRAVDEKAVARLYGLKKRHNKPGTIIASSVDQLVDLGIKKRYLTAVELFWPNPLSIIITVALEFEYVHQGKQSLACRVVNGPQKLLDVLSIVGPLLTTSANHPREPEATNIAQAQKYFGDNIEFYVDGGDLSGRLPSTVIRVVDDAIEVLREGAVKIDETGRITS